MEKYEPSQMLCGSKGRLGVRRCFPSRQDTPDRPEPTIPVVTPRIWIFPPRRRRAARHALYRRKIQLSGFCDLPLPWQAQSIRQDSLLSWPFSSETLEQAVANFIRFIDPGAIRQHSRRLAVKAGTMVDLRYKPELCLGRHGPVEIAHFCQRGKRPD